MQCFHAAPLAFRWLNYRECKPQIQQLLDRRSEGERVEEWTLYNHSTHTDVMRFWSTQVRAVIGPHGGAFYNLFYTTSPTAVLEVWPIPPEPVPSVQQASSASAAPTAAAAAGSTADNTDAESAGRVTVPRSSPLDTRNAGTAGSTATADDGSHSPTSRGGVAPSSKHVPSANLFWEISHLRELQHWVLPVPSVSWEDSDVSVNCSMVLEALGQALSSVAAPGSGEQPVLEPFYQGTKWSARR